MKTRGNPIIFFFTLKIHVKDGWDTDKTKLEKIGSMWAELSSVELEF